MKNYRKKKICLVCSDIRNSWCACCPLRGRHTRFVTNNFTICIFDHKTIQIIWISEAKKKKWKKTARRHCLTIPLRYHSAENYSLTLKRLGGPLTPPSTFRAITLQRVKLSPRHFMTFFFRVSRTFWHQICDARGPYGSEVT